MKFKQDRYDHTRMPKTAITKEKMSAAKKGIKKSEAHRLNMTVSHLIRCSERNKRCTIEHILKCDHYDNSRKIEILNNIAERNISISPKAIKALGELND